MGKFRRLLHSLEAINRSRASGILEWELSELEHIFGLLSAGMLVGLPTPPAPISFELLPDMENHLVLLVNKAETARGPLSDLFSILDIN
jgi:hypothetical protein